MTILNTMHFIEQHKNNLSTAHEKITTGKKHVQHDMVISDLAAGTSAKLKVDNNTACLKNIKNYVDVLGMASTHAQQALDSLSTLKSIAIQSTQVASDATRATEYQPQFSALLTAYENAIDSLYKFEGKVFFDGSFAENCISGISGTNINTENIDLTSMNWTVQGLGLFATGVDAASYQTLVDSLAAADPNDQAAVEAATTALNNAAVKVDTKDDAINAATIIGQAQEKVKQGMVLINAKSQALNNIADIVSNNRLVQQNISQMNLDVDPIAVNAAIQESKNSLEQAMSALKQSIWMDGLASEYLG